MSDITKTITPNEPADFTPTRGVYKELQPFRYWCQKVLPLVYDDSLGYYELLCKVVQYLNVTMEDVETLNGDVTNVYASFSELQDYVNNYFTNLDVQEEINNKLDSMASDGSLSEILSSIVLNTLPALIVASTSDMTDHNRTYVLSSNSHIYQWNASQSAFVDTGIVYGGNLGNVLGANGLLANGTDLNNVANNTVYYLNIQSTGNYLNYPNFGIDSENAILFTIATETGLKLQFIMFSRGRGGMRSYHTSDLTWVDWEIITPYWRSAPVNSDLNNLVEGAIYYMFTQATGNYTNAPSQIANDNAILFNESYTDTDGNTAGMQIVISSSGIVMERVYSTATGWGIWGSSSQFFGSLPSGSDLNSVMNNSIYYMLAQSTANYSNYPSFFNTGVNGALLTYGNSAYTVQIIIDNNSCMAFRFKSAGSWKDWKSQDYTLAVNRAPFNAYRSWEATVGTFKHTQFETINAIVHSVGEASYFHKTTQMVDNSYYTLIDDDTSTQDYVEAYHTACTANNVIGNYAVITEHLDATMLNTLKGYEIEGFSMLYHCESQISDYNGTRNANVLNNFVTGLREFKESGLIDTRLWVIPYGNDDKSIVELAYMYNMQGAFTTRNTTPAFPQMSPYTIPRINIGPSTPGGAYDSLDEIKTLIDTYDGRGAWFVFTTHVNSWDSEGVARQLFDDVIAYVKTKGWNNVNASEGFNLYKNYMNGIF